jgi:two-component system, NarL family, sensor kinase
MDKEELKLLIFSISLILVILGVALIIFLFYFQKKKADYLRQQEVAKKHYIEELSKSEIEIREQTLENISWEIHDNVGQLLSVAKMQLNIFQSNLTKEQQKELNESSDLISKSLQELRSLAKTLNPKHIKNLGFIKAIKLELDRYNRMRFIEAKLEIKGEPYQLKSKNGIILFRILQEFFNNTLKHAKSSKLCVTLDYKPKNLEILAEDKGVGFNIDSLDKSKGLGLETMKSRAALIGATLKLTSEENKGTTIFINYPHL